MQEKMEQKTTLIRNLGNFLHSLLKKIVVKKPHTDLSHRKNTLISQIDFLIDTLSMSKMDIIYMERLKMPLTPEEKIYFTQQVDRLNSSIRTLLWFRENAAHNDKFWKRFFK